MIDLSVLQTKLRTFHKPLSDSILEEFSPIAGNQFPGEFNVSGFHDKVLNLPDQPSSFWGVDRCLRIQETFDRTHSAIFHMGIFAKAVQLNENF